MMENEFIWWRWLLEDVLPIVGASIVAVLGWLLNRKLEHERKIRDIRLDYLMKAYLDISDATNRNGLDAGSNMALKTERAIDKINLFGTKEQIEMLTKTLNNLGKSKEGISFDEVLNALRDELRQEMRREPIDGNRQWYRIVPKRNE